MIAASFVNLVISITAQREDGHPQAPPRDAGAGLGADRAAGRSRRSASRSSSMTVLLARRPLRLRRHSCRPRHDPRHRVHGGRRLDHVLRPRLRALDRDQERGRGAADGAGDHAAALLHLRHLHPERSPCRPGCGTSRSVFPVQHLADGAPPRVTSPATTGIGIVWSDIGVLAIWAAIGLAVALRALQLAAEGGGRLGRDEDERVPGGVADLGAADPLGHALALPRRPGGRS